MRADRACASSGVACGARGQRDRGTGDVCACRRATARAASCRVRASAPNTRLALRYDSIAPARSCDDSSSAARSTYARARNTGGATGRAAITRPNRMSARSVSRARAVHARPAEQRDGIARAQGERAIERALGLVERAALVGAPAGERERVGLARHAIRRAPQSRRAPRRRCPRDRAAVPRRARRGTRRPRSGARPSRSSKRPSSRCARAERAIRRRRRDRRSPPSRARWRDRFRRARRAARPHPSRARVARERRRVHPPRLRPRRAAPATRQGWPTRSWKYSSSTSAMRCGKSGLCG